MKSIVFFLSTVAISAILVINACKKPKDETPPDNTAPTPTVAVTCTPDTVFTPGTGTGPRLIFKFKFDSTQLRLNNLGQPAGVSAGNAAQSPKFNLMSQHYIELAGDLDSLG